MPGLSFAVVIPHYNDVARLDRCLSALLSQDLSDTDVIVADNGSTEDLSAVQAKHAEARFITAPKKGAAEARNAGAAATQAEWLFFLDADCVPSETWLATAKALANRGLETIYGGQVTVFDETPSPRSGAEAFETVFAFDQKRYIDEMGFSVTANLLTRRDVFEQVGPMIVGVSEDKEWCQRATSKGFELVYAPELSAAHPTRQDWAALAKKWRRVSDELGGLALKEPLGRLKWALRALAMPLSAVAHLPQVLRHPALSRAEKGQGALTLFRLRGMRMVWMLHQSFTS